MYFMPLMHEFHIIYFPQMARINTDYTVDFLVKRKGAKVFF